MIQERTVSVGCVVAVLFWSLTVLFICAGMACGVLAHDDHGVPLAMALMTTGLACSAAAATVTIRNMIHAQNRLLRDAFQMGRESVTPLRRTQ